MSEIGHNTELTPEAKRALRMHHLRQLSDIDAEMKPLKERRKEVRALAKADGFKLQELDAAYRLMHMEDSSIFVAEIEELIDIAQAFNALPPGEQGSLFPDRRDAAERQYDEGVALGLQGKDAPGADEQDKLRGWTDGQKQVADAMAAAMERRNADKADPDEVIPGSTDDVDVPFAAEAA